jgi:hypothetical protein
VKKRHTTLLTALVGAGIVIGMARVEKEADPAVSAAYATVASLPAPSSLFASLPARPGLAATQSSLFADQSLPPPLPASLTAAAPAPAAPPNPYRCAGTLQTAEGVIVFLALGDRIYEAQPGADLVAGYRVENVTPQRVILVYTPLGTKEEIATGWTPRPAMTAKVAPQVAAAEQAPLAPVPGSSLLIVGR